MSDINTSKPYANLYIGIFLIFEFTVFNPNK